ncbi:DUF4166 domain-containing protein [Leucobacter ruminantium]|uniref:DUF4166 domain-containing protein n=1 Tax=Leucobacter ruminantium TaxID=1289170 RepID=A0A939LXG9_9MICO|nr:DUF4166 domain-containing protein [Leucobacter ruminantium]MBO1804197.1 DUF4166 domain-containing protein [Leucobacter ruminantium]
MALRSPYEAALGERIHDLHPELRRYFSAIPEGCVGLGRGEFSEFGSRSRWLRPLLRAFERRGALYGGYAEAVPFRIVNRTIAAGPGTEAGTAVARREIGLPGGEWVMSDDVVRVGDRVVDRIGAPWTLSASFEVDVRDGALVLTSRAVGVVLGRLRLRIPRPLAPVVRLRKSRAAEGGGQYVELTVDAPVVGRIYGYRGGFEYAIVPEEQA